MESQTGSFHVQGGFQSRRACVQCNRKKVKCDMQRPQCALCLRVGIPCTFPTRRKSPQIRKAPKTLPTSTDIERLRRLMTIFGSDLRNDQDLEAILGSPRGTEHNDISPIEDQQGASASSQEQHPFELNEAPGEVPDGMNIYFNQSHENCRNTQTPRADLSLSQTDNTQSAGYNTQPVRCDGISTDTLSPEAENELIEIYFDKIQAWLPLLHRPRFYEKYVNRPPDQKIDYAALSLEERLLFNGIFALAARHSDSSIFAGIDRIERGHRFVDAAREIYEMARVAMDPPNLLLLQGCILLAFSLYASGPCAKGWVLNGVCVSLAYDLDLNRTDDDDSAELDKEEWVRREELRRAFWLVWELDAFGSIVSMKPYSIDRRRTAVLLPVSDEAWFAESPVSSARLDTDPSKAWKTLQNCENQDERAWFLIANFLISVLHDLTNRREGNLLEEKLELENAFNCFKLTLPSSFDLGTGTFGFHADGFARSNWIISTNLLLASSDILISHLAEVPSSSLSQHSSLGRVSDLHSRAVKISRIISRWSPEFVSLCHPFIACALLPVHIPGDEPDQVRPKLWAQYQETVKLVFSHFAKLWKLGHILLALATLLEKPLEIGPYDLEVARRFAVFFPPAIRNEKARTASSASRGNGPGTTRNPGKDTEHSSVTVMETDPTLHVREHGYEHSTRVGQNTVRSNHMVSMPMTSRQDVMVSGRGSGIEALPSITGDHSYYVPDELGRQALFTGWNPQMLEFFEGDGSIDITEM